MKPIEPPDTHHLLAAQGWLGLGNHVEADAELARISPALRNHPDVLEASWGVHAAKKNWPLCVETAAELVKLAPDRPEGWIHRSYALHELGKTMEAAALLERAVDLFPGEWLIRYNMACYACRMENEREALDWLRKAMKLGDAKRIRQMALEDPDLEPLRRKIAFPEPSRED